MASINSLINANDTDGAVTPAVEHEPPSLPASPDPKRVKAIDPLNPAAGVAGTSS